MPDCIHSDQSIHSLARRMLPRLLGLLAILLLGSILLASPALATVDEWQMSGNPDDVQLNPNYWYKLQLAGAVQSNAQIGSSLSSAGGSSSQLLLPGVKLSAGQGVNFTATLQDGSSLTGWAYLEAGPGVLGAGIYYTTLCLDGVTRKSTSWFAYNPTWDIQLRYYFYFDNGWAGLVTYEQLPPYSSVIALTVDNGMQDAVCKNYSFSQLQASPIQTFEAQASGSYSLQYDGYVCSMEVYQLEFMADANGNKDVRPDGGWDLFTLLQSWIGGLINVFVALASIPLTILGVFYFIFVENGLLLLILYIILLAIRVLYDRRNKDMIDVLFDFGYKLIDDIRALITIVQALMDFSAQAVQALAAFGQAAAQAASALGKYLDAAVTTLALLIIK